MSNLRRSFDWHLKVEDLQGIVVKEWTGRSPETRKTLTHAYPNMAWPRISSLLPWRLRPRSRDLGISSMIFQPHEGSTAAEELHRARLNFEDISRAGCPTEVWGEVQANG